MHRINWTLAASWVSPDLFAWLHSVGTIRPGMTNPFVKLSAFGCLVWPTSRAVFFILAEKASFHLSELSGKRLQPPVQEASLNGRLNRALESQMMLLISVVVGWVFLGKITRFLFLNFCIFFFYVYFFLFDFLFID